MDMSNVGYTQGHLSAMSRIVGKRSQQAVTFDACGELLKQGCMVNDAMHQSLDMTGGGIPKGVYHFKSHQEANEHQDRCLAKKMAELARSRHG